MKNNEYTYITDILNQLEYVEGCLKILRDNDSLQIIVGKGVDEFVIETDKSENIYQILIHRYEQDVEDLREKLKEILDVKNFEPSILESCK